MDQSKKNSRLPERIESTGPWPFISRHVLVWASGERTVRYSRHHRKELRERDPGEAIKWLRCLWMPGRLNWWIGVVFSFGALFFMLGSIVVLMPSLARAWALEANTVNGIFFVGSVPFTIAAYLQLFQAGNAGAFTPQRESGARSVVIIGWLPQQIGWLSCALQFVGTLLFNLDTFDAMLPGMDWLQQDLAIWAPNFIGSILFLASGYLAFIETSHAHWSWQPNSLSWWVTFINFLGCVAFMISAIFAFVPPSVPGFDAASISVVFTLIGGACFFTGSLLMLPETIVAT